MGNLLHKSSPKPKLLPENYQNIPNNIHHLNLQQVLNHKPSFDIFVNYLISSLEIENLYFLIEVLQVKYEFIKAHPTKLIKIYDHYSSTNVKYNYRFYNFETQHAMELNAETLNISSFLIVNHLNICQFFQSLNAFKIDSITFNVENSIVFQFCGIKERMYQIYLQYITMDADWEICLICTEREYLTNVFNTLFNNRNYNFEDSFWFNIMDNVMIDTAIYLLQNSLLRCLDSGKLLNVTSSKINDNYYEKSEMKIESYDSFQQFLNKYYLQTMKLLCDAIGNQLYFLVFEFLYGYSVYH